MKMTMLSPTMRAGIMNSRPMSAEKLDSSSPSTAPAWTGAFRSGVSFSFSGRDIVPSLPVRHPAVDTGRARAWVAGRLDKGGRAGSSRPETWRNDELV